MVLVEQDPVMVHATGVSPTTGVLTVLSDTTVTGAHVASLLPVLLESGRHFSALCLRPHKLGFGDRGDLLSELHIFTLWSLLGFCE